jgi:NTE family protein
MKLSCIKHLVLSGGGLLGISYIGLFKYLEEQNATGQIETITGCSAGSIFGSLFAIGYNSSEVENIIKSMNFKEYLNVTAEAIINFMRLKGLESGKNLMSLIKQCIKDKTGDENITFRQIQEMFNINLIIGVTNLTTSQFELLGYQNYPDLPIYQAINASIAIPFVFEPVIINSDVYCDGGLLDNLPIAELIKLVNNLSISAKAEKTSNDNKITNEERNIPIEEYTTSKECNILGIYLMNKFNIITANNYKSLSISHYFNAIFRSVSSSYISKLNETMEDNYKIIIFEIPCDIMTFIKLNATIDDIDNIINIAYNITKEKL